MCVCVCFTHARVYSRTYARSIRIMNLLYSFDIVTVTPIMGYKILPETLSPEKRQYTDLSVARDFCYAGSVER